MSDGFIAFLVLLCLAIFLAGIISFFLVIGARSRLRRLEQHVARASDPGLRDRVIALERRLAAFEEGKALRPDQEPAKDIPVALPAEPADEPIETPEATAEPAMPSSIPEEAVTEPSSPLPAPTRRRDLETALGTRWTVWVGGLALALGGLFLVRYSIEQGLIGPLARVLMGGLFAALLLAAGEYLRRKGLEPEGPKSPVVSIPGMITAAGTMTAFATVYAAFALYQLLPPAAAFVLLGIIAVTTMVAALLHGPSLAALGLVGALTVPLLIGGRGGELWPVVAYLAAVSGASLALARARRWKWLAIAAIIGAILWTLILGGGHAQIRVAASRAHLIIQLLLAVLFLIVEPFRNTPDEEARPDRFSHVILLAFTGTVIFLLGFGHEPSPLFAGLVMAIGLATAFFFAPAAGASILAGTTVLAALFLWPHMVQAVVEGAVERPLQPPDLPEATNEFLSFALFGTLAVALVTGYRIWRGRALPLVTAGIYGVASVVPPLLALLIAWWRVANFELSPTLAITAAVLSAVFAVAAGRFLREALQVESRPLALGAEAFAAAAIAALALGLTIGLERAGLTLSLSLAAAGAAFVTTRGPLNSLRGAVGVLGLIVLARIAWDPTVGGDLGQTPIFNWLLVGYGVPTLCFFLATRWLRPGGEDWALRLCESLTVLFAGLLVLFEIRHLVNGGDILTRGAGLVELGLDVTAALGFSATLIRIQGEKPNIVYVVAGFALTLLSLLIGIFGLGIEHNPLFAGEVPGGPIVNSLLIGYAAPAIAAFVLALVARYGRRSPLLIQAAVIFGFIMLFLYVTLETRRLFQGPDITADQGLGNAELWTYSAIWLAMGLGLLVAGLINGSRPLRLASAVLIVATIAKAFLIDMSGLEGVWRAASFIGLGIVLIGIGLIYQRLLVQKPEPGQPGPT